VVNTSPRRHYFPDPTLLHSRFTNRKPTQRDHSLAGPILRLDCVHGEGPRVGYTHSRCSQSHQPTTTPPITASAGTILKTTLCACIHSQLRNDGANEALETRISLSSYVNLYLLICYEWIVLQYLALFFSLMSTALFPLVSALSDCKRLGGLVHVSLPSPVLCMTRFLNGKELNFVKYSDFPDYGQGEGGGRQCCSSSSPFCNLFCNT